MNEDCHMGVSAKTDRGMFFADESFAATPLSTPPFHLKTINNKIIKKV